MPRPAKYTRANFWEWVDSSQGPEACHPWLGHICTNGYGLVSFLGKVTTTAVAAYELTYGPLPAGAEVVRHSCDNRACCNPAHLIPGTHSQNRLDAFERGRVPPRGKPLTVAEVNEARERYREGQRIIAIARAIGRDREVIRKAIHGQTYLNVTPESEQGCAAD